MNTNSHTRCFLMTIVWLIFFYSMTDAQLIMDTHIYAKIIETVHMIFNNTCIIFMHTNENPMQSLGPYDAQRFMSIFAYISRLHVRTSAYTIKTFKDRIGNSYFNLKRPLFVLLNDSEDLKQQFTKEIAPWISMAYINWIIFFQKETSIDNFLSEIFIPLDCIFLIVKISNNDETNHALTEAYNIDQGRELITNLFGIWNENEGLVITNLTLYQRRNDLNGQLIRIASVPDPPISLIEKNSSGEMIGIKGFFGTMIQILQKNINCTVTYTECDTWGYLLPNGSWTGIVGMLVRKEIDLAATELLMTSDRLEAIEFTTPVFSTKCRTFIKRPYYTAIKWTAYSDPFNNGIWISLLAIIIISSSFILLSFKILPDENIDEHDINLPNFIETFFRIFGVICSQGHTFALVDAIRIIDLVVHFTGVIILAAYSAALISFLAVKVFVMPFSSMEGLLNDGSYKFGVIRDSADFKFFQSTSDKILQRMFREILDDIDNLPYNYLEGLNNICLKDKYAFMITDNMFAILEHQVPCILEPLDTIIQTTLAMGVPKRSPFRGIINSNILLMRDSGVLQRVIATELVVQSLKINDRSISVDIFDVVPLLILIVIGSIFGMTILALEKIHYKYISIYFKHKKSTKRKY